MSGTFEREHFPPSERRQHGEWKADVWAEWSRLHRRRAQTPPLCPRLSPSVAAAVAVVAEPPRSSLRSSHVAGRWRMMMHAVARVIPAIAGVAAPRVTSSAASPQPAASRAEQQQRSARPLPTNSIASRCVGGEALAVPMHAMLRQQRSTGSGRRRERWRQPRRDARRDASGQSREPSWSVDAAGAKSERWPAMALQSCERLLCASPFLAARCVWCEHVV